MMVFGGDKSLGYIFLQPKDIIVLIKLLEKSTNGKYGKRQKKFDISILFKKKSKLEAVFSLYHYDNFVDYFWINEESRADLLLEFNCWLAN